jgi:phosphoserine phosphatase
MYLKLKDAAATRVILVRHGQSTYNALGLYQGCSDESVLTDIGYSDARKTGNFLKGLTFDAVYTSSLKRAQQTAKEILQVVAPSLEQEIIVSDLLRETDLPAWQGKAFQYVKENFPQEYSNWKQCPHEFYMNLTPQKRLYPALDLYERVNKFWQQVLPRYIGKTLLLVVHGGTNRALISTALGITPDRYHCIQQSNCGISILNFSDGTLESGRLEVMNLACHVGENLPEGGKGLRLLLIPSDASIEQINSLAVQLKGVNIFWCLIDAFNDSRTLAKEVIKYHPETADLKVIQDLPEWQKTIHSKNIDSNSSVTGLVVAKKETIKTLISQAIGVNPDDKDRLHIKQGTVSSTHYSGEHHPPVLQAMNVGWVGAAQPNIR